MFPEKSIRLKMVGLSLVSPLKPDPRIKQSPSGGLWDPQLPFWDPEIGRESIRVDFWAAFSMGASENGGKDPLCSLVFKGGPRGHHSF